ncbi:FAD-dependent monooxygenase [Pyruvatibacter sp.]|uniref:FAD-dependent monooxygenase n=1 Tax=Pyruvatibacter sp. TaxID=1981328 RepID=UPI0032EA9777
MKAVIAGGGIGGLTAALAFRHFGWDVDVFERAPELGEVGAGIQISPNGMKVLQALGVAQRIEASAFEPEALEFRMGQSGVRVFRVPVGDAARQRWGAPYLHVHRADLVAALAAQLEAGDAPGAAGSVHLSTAVSGYENTSSGVTAKLGSSGSVQGDVLIGADGIHSSIRTQMVGADAPVFTGNVAWRAVVPMDQLGDLAPPPTACVWAGPGRHAVTYRLRRGTLANFVGVVERDDWRSESWTQQGTRDEALADYAGWHPILTNLIERADAHYRWALFDRKPLPRWSDGRVCLMGDAAHPTLPFMAQGAVMAIEDAYVLARECAAAPDDISSALERVYALRIARTSGVQKGSRANAATFHKRTSLAQLSTYGPMWLAGQLAPGFVLSRQDWLYAEDVTAPTAARSGRA